MSLLKEARRIAIAAASIAVAAFLTAFAAVAVPQPLFSYHVVQGQLQLWSDHPFDSTQGALVLADVQRRIEASPLPLGTETHRVFIANEPWRRRLVFLWNHGAAGVSYYPLRNVFIRESDIGADRVLRPAGPVPPPRTLAYYAAHEIAHTLIGKKIGMLANWRLPRWIREGLPDYIAFGGDIDIDALAAASAAGDCTPDPGCPDPYARYRLLVAFMLDREGWSADRLLMSRMPQADAEWGLKAGHGNKIESASSRRHCSSTNRRLSPAPGRSDAARNVSAKDGSQARNSPKIPKG